MKEVPYREGETSRDKIKCRSSFLGGQVTEAKKKKKPASVFITALLTTFIKCIALKKHWIKYRCHIGATISC